MSEADQPAQSAVTEAAPPAPPPARRRHWLRLPLAILLQLLLLIVLVLGWVLGTQSGLRTTLALVDDLAPGLLAVERADGRVLGDLHLAGLKVRAPGLEVDLGSFDLRWNPLAALTGTLRIQEIKISDLDIVAAPSEEEEEAAPLELPDVVLPLQLELESALVERLSIGEPGGAPPFRVERIALAAGWAGSTLDLRELSVVLPEPLLNAKAGGKAELAGVYPLELALSWDLTQAPDANLTGEARVTGNLEQLKLEHRLAGSAEAKLDAVVHAVLDAPRWEAVLEIVRVDLPAFQTDLPAVDLSGRLETSGDLDDARVQGSLAGEAPDLPDFGRLNVALDLTWRDRVLDIQTMELTESESGALLSADGQLDLRDADAGTFAVEAAWEKLRWPLTGELIAESRQGKLDASGTFESFRYALSGEVWGHQIPEASLSLAGEGTQESTEIQTLELDALNGKLQAKGRVAWAPELSWDVSLSGAGVEPALQWPAAAVGAVALEATSAGNLDGFQYNLDGGVAGGEAYPAVSLKLNGEGDVGSTRIAVLRLEALQGHVEGKGEVGWDPNLRWDAELDLADVNPGAHWKEWPGNLGGRITSAGSLEAEGPDLNAVIEAFKGKLRGYPVDASGQVRMQDGEIQVEQFKVASGPSSLSVDGGIAEEFDLKFDLSSPDLGSLMPEAKGSVQANGTVSGTPAAPAVKLELAVNGVDVAGQGIRRLGGNVDVNLAQGGPMRLDLTGEGLAAGGMIFDTLRIQGTGDMGAHQLSAKVGGEQLALDLKTAGGLKEDNHYQGQVKGLELRSPQYGDWRLQKPANLSVAAGRIEAGPVCIRDAEGSGGCLSFEQPEPQKWHALVDLDKLSFALLKDFMPEGLELDGSARAKADLRAAGGVLTGKASVEIPRGVLSTDSGDQGKLVDFSSASLGLDASGRGLSATLKVPLVGLGDLSGDLSLAGWRLDAPARPGQPLRGRVRANVNDLGIVSRLAPDVTGVTGKIDVDLGLAGTIAKPGVSGYAKVLSAGLDVPLVGLKVSDFNLDAVAQGSRRIDYRGGFNTGKGRLEIGGESQMEQAGWATRLRVSGDKVTIADSKEYFLVISPDIEARVDTKGAAVTGKLTVPEARIRPHTIPPGSVSPSSDVALASAEEAKPGLPMSVDLRLVLGDNVSIDAFGLRGLLQGDLRVLQSPGKELLGDGQISVVDANYRLSGAFGVIGAVGKPLKVEQGVLVFAKTPLSNPGLVLLAKREGGDMTAGVRIVGTVKQPKMTFFSDSDPGMTQAEVTNYLITGIPPKRGKEDASGQALAVGTYVAPKLYMEYESALGDEADKIKLRYDLNNWIELQTETGDSQGGDIFFKFER